MKNGFMSRKKKFSRVKKLQFLNGFCNSVEVGQILESKDIRDPWRVVGVDRNNNILSVVRYNG